MVDFTSTLDPARSSCGDASDDQGLALGPALGPELGSSLITSLLHTGTGKSAVLKKICKIAEDNHFQPIRLAPSGIAAVNIKGQTLHWWFHITKMDGYQGFPSCNSNKIREQLIDVYDEGLRPFFLLCEVLMISGMMLMCNKAVLSLIRVGKRRRGQIRSEQK